MSKYTKYCCLLILLSNFSLQATIILGSSRTLDIIDPSTSIVVDALMPADRDLLLISKHGSPPEVLRYQVNFDDEQVVFKNKQEFKGFAPILFSNRDFIFAFKPLAKQSGERAALFVLDKTNEFLPFHIFDQDIKKIAATEQSNFLATIDYALLPAINIITPRLKLFNSLKTPKAGQRPVERQGNAQSVVFDPGIKSTISQSLVTALAMSPLGRVKVGNNAYPANRVVALAHSSKTQHALNIWYFPNVEKDFNTGQGRMTVSLKNSADTIAFSPNTFGLLLVTNKSLGEISVMQIDLPEKRLTTLSTLGVELPLGDKATNISAVFGDDDEIVAGIDQSLYLFKKNEEGYYARENLEPVKDFAYLEYFSKILKKGESFMALGTKGNLQFFKID